MFQLHKIIALAIIWQIEVPPTLCNETITYFSIFLRFNFLSSCTFIKKSFHKFKDNVFSVVCCNHLLLIHYFDLPSFVFLKEANCDFIILFTQSTIEISFNLPLEVNYNITFSHHSLQLRA